MRNELKEIGRTGAEGLTQYASCVLPRIAVDDLSPGPECCGPIAFPAATPQSGSAAVGGELFDQTCLPDAGLAADEHQPAIASARRV